MSNERPKNLFDKIEEKTKLKPDEIFKIANSVKDANFKDERTVRQLIKQLSKMVNIPVPKEKEDLIVRAIVNQKVPMDMAKLTEMFKK